MVGLGVMRGPRVHGCGAVLGPSCQACLELRPVRAREFFRCLNRAAISPGARALTFCGRGIRCMMSGVVHTMKGLLLEELTWKEAKQAFEDYGAIAIPIGAVLKEHGPHLPLKTDFMLATHWAAEVARRFPIIVAPVVGWGYYPAFIDFAGSVSLDARTFMDLLTDICRSFVRNGIRKILWLNTGVSTTPPLLLLTRELNQAFSGTALVGLMNLVDLGREEIEGQLLQPSGSHADELETSLILAIDESAVDMSKATRDFGHGKKGGPIQRPSKMQARDERSGQETSGIFGDATLASKEKGEQFWEIIFNQLDPIQDFLSSE